MGEISGKDFFVVIKSQKAGVSHLKILNSKS